MCDQRKNKNKLIPEESAQTYNNSSTLINDDREENIFIQDQSINILKIGKPQTDQLQIIH